MVTHQVMADHRRSAGLLRNTTPPYVCAATAVPSLRHEERLLQPPPSAPAVSSRAHTPLDDPACPDDFASMKSPANPGAGDLSAPPILTVEKLEKTYASGFRALSNI